MFETAVMATDLSRVGVALSECGGALRTLGVEKIIVAECVKSGEALSIAYSYSDRKVESLIEQECAQLRDHGFEVDREVLTGNPGRNVRRLVKDRGATLVVTGTDHHSLTGELLGSDTSWSVIEHSLVPVLLVPIVRSPKDDEELCVHPTACEELLGQLLFPTDFSENADIAIPVVEDLVRKGAAALTLLHVQDSSRIDPHLSERLNEFNSIDEQRLLELKERIAESGTSEISTTVSYGRPVPEILRVVKEIGCTCLVLGRHGRGAILEAILGSVSHNVIRKAEVPVLIVPHET